MDTDKIGFHERRTNSCFNRLLVCRVLVQIHAAVFKHNPHSMETTRVKGYLSEQELGAKALANNMV